MTFSALLYCGPASSISFPISLSSAALIAALLFGRDGVAQQPVTIVTGSGSNLQTAINAASSGDILVVRDGPYDSMTINGKDLTLVEDTGHSVVIGAPCIVRNLASNQNVVIRGFTSINASGTGHIIEANSGHVWFEDCRLTASAAPPDFVVPPQSVLVSECHAVVFARCDINSASLFASDVDGLVVYDSSIACYECTIAGGVGAPNSNDGGDGMVVNAAYAHLSSCTVQGGHGGSGVTLWVAGVMTCTNGGSGGDGIVLLGGSLVEYIATTFVAGGGGSGGTGCTAGPSGVATKVLFGSLQALPCAARLLTVGPSPAIGGSTLVTATAIGVPGELAFATYNAAPMFQSLPSNCGVQLVSTQFYQSMGVIGGSGQITFSFTPPAYASGLGADMFMQLGTFDPGTGSLRLGGNSVLTIR
jgi:hypothetical protein